MKRHTKLFVIIVAEVAAVFAILAIHTGLSSTKASAAPCTREATAINYDPGNNHDYIGADGYFHRLVWIGMNATANSAIPDPAPGSYLRSQDNCDGNYGGAMSPGNPDLILLKDGPFRWFDAGLVNPVNPVRIELGNPTSSAKPFDDVFRCGLTPPQPNPPVGWCTGNASGGLYSGFVDDSGRLVIGGINGNKTIFCASIATGIGGGYIDCPSDIKDYPPPRSGSGFLYRQDQCMLIFGDPGQCNGGTYTKWYQGPGMYGSTDLTPEVQKDPWTGRYLYGFYNHYDARNTVQGGFGVGNSYELLYPLNRGSCSVSVVPTNGGFIRPGDPLTATVTLNNTGTKPWQNLISDPNLSPNGGYRFLDGAGTILSAPGFPGVVVQPGTSYGFSVGLTAPATGGPVSWNLYQDNQFIATCNTAADVSIVKHFELTPIATVTVAPTVENPQTGTFNSGIQNNSGFTINSAPGNGVEITREFYRVHNGVRTNFTITSGPGAGPAAVNVPPAGLSYIDSVVLAGLGLDAGDQVCGSTFISPGSGDVDPGTGTIVARGPNKPVPLVPFCVTIEDRPYVTTYGNDVVAGGGFGTAATCGASADIKTFYDTARSVGSGAQLAAFALGIGTIEEFTSASQRSSPPTRTRGLTFANTGAGLWGGGFGGANCITNYWAASAPSGVLTSSINIGGLGSNVYNYRANGPAPARLLTINGGAIANGTYLKVYVEGNVYIASNITYANTSWPTTAAIPFFQLIVHGDIRIAPGVTRLDGIYIAQPNAPLTGRIITCADGAAGSTTGIFPNTSSVYLPPTGACNSRLQVNGAFIAQKVQLTRTKNSLRNGAPGEAADASQAAEVFNFSPESYLTEVCAVVPGACANGSRDDAITSLPPIL